MSYEVEVEREVRDWLAALPEPQYRYVLRIVQRLLETPTSLGDLTKSLGEGLWELRFKRLGDVSIRITYWITPDKRIVMLTVFAKTRMNERKQVERAKRVMKACKGCRPGHEPAEDEYRRFEDA